MDKLLELSRRQRGMVARKQLHAIGLDADYVRNQIAAGRWAARSRMVISMFTGALGWREQVWLGVLHAGGSALVGGLTALEWHGLKQWHRDEVTILVDDEQKLEAVESIRFFRTRRPLSAMRGSSVVPIARIERATLLFAAYDRSARTAQGLLAAVVQQRLTSPSGLINELELMRPLRRSRLFRTTLNDISGGSQSLAELDIGRLCRTYGLPAPGRQTRRRDNAGRLRFTDCEWTLVDGRSLILEIDGAFHMDVAHWEEDLEAYELCTPGRALARPEVHD